MKALKCAEPRALKTPVIFDGRNLYEPATVKAYGIDYVGIGKKIEC